MMFKRVLTTRSATVLKAFALAGLAMLVLPLTDFSSDEAFAQRRSRERAIERAEREAERAAEREAAERAAAARREAQARAQAQASPAIDTSTPFGSALAACDKLQEEDAQFVLPGLKGEMKLDRCYRGRRHLTCRFDAVSTEDNALMSEFTRIVEQRYQDVNNVDGICKIGFDALVKDLAGTVEFNKRFAAARSEFEARTSCASKIKASIKDVTLPELVQAPEVLKSMIDAIDGDVTKVSAVQEQAAALATKIDASQKSIAVLQKIHRAMCMKAAPDEVKAEAKPATN